MGGDRWTPTVRPRLLVLCTITAPRTTPVHAVLLCHACPSRPAPWQPPWKRTIHNGRAPPSRPRRQAPVFSARLSPQTDQGSAHCAGRMNASTACSSSGDDHPRPLSISPHGVRCKRRGRCQIPWRTSTQLPAQIVRSARLQTMFRPTRPSSCLHSRSLAAPNASKQRPGIRHGVGRPHPPSYTSPLMSLTHMQYTHLRL